MARNRPDGNIQMDARVDRFEDFRLLYPSSLRGGLIWSAPEDELRIREIAWTPLVYWKASGCVRDSGRYARCVD